MSWQNNLHNSFGSADHKFARHPLDKQRALNALNEAIQNRVSYADFIAEAQNYLTQQGCTQQHIQNEISKVKKIESFF